MVSGIRHLQGYATQSAASFGKSGNISLISLSDQIGRNGVGTAEKGHTAGNILFRYPLV